MKKHRLTIILIAVLLVGLSLLLYPSFADWWNSFHQTKAIVDYDQAIQEMNKADYTALFEEAEDYNRRIKQIEHPLVFHKNVTGYNEALNILGNGVIGYIEIPKINVSLPIYHGTSESVLQVAVGHLEGTTLPIGGEGNHCVLSAHRGLPSAQLFSDLDKMEVGDEFTITVLDRLLTYRVDSIIIVKPHQVEPLYPVEGEDYCTLFTCTPYGVNSHRLLVRGHRVDNREEEQVYHVTTDALQIKPLIIAPILLVPILLLFVALLLVSDAVKRREDKRKARTINGEAINLTKDIDT